MALPAALHPRARDAAVYRWMLFLVAAAFIISAAAGQEDGGPAADGFALAPLAMPAAALGGSPAAPTSSSPNQKQQQPEPSAGLDGAADPSIMSNTAALGGGGGSQGGEVVVVTDGDLQDDDGGAAAAVEGSPAAAVDISGSTMVTQPNLPELPAPAGELVKGALWLFVQPLYVVRLCVFVCKAAIDQGTAATFAPPPPNCAGSRKAGDSVPGRFILSLTANTTTADALAG